MIESYLGLINNFWQKDNEHNFSVTETALYFYILKSANAARWKNPIGLSNAVAMAKFSIGKTSFDTAKRKLKNAGLIDFNSGNGRGMVCQYTIMDIEKVAYKPPLSKHLSTHLSDSNAVRKRETSIEKEEDLTKEEEIAPGGISPHLIKKKEETREKETIESIIAKNKEVTETKKAAFVELLKPYHQMYGSVMLNSFFYYWTEPGTAGTKLKWELERTWDLQGRLRAWHRNERKWEK